jgi:hypothetical protein
MAEKDAKKPKPAAADSALDDQEYNEICLARLGNMEDKTLTPILKAWQGLIGDYDQHSPEVRGTKVNEIRRLLALYDLRHLAFGECLANRQETDAARANEIAQQTQADTAAFAGLYGELEGARVQRRKRMEAEMMAKEIATKKSRTEIGEQLKASRAKLDASRASQEDLEKAAEQKQLRMQLLVHTVVELSALHDVAATDGKDAKTSKKA